MYADHEGCIERTYRNHSAVPLRRGEHRGDRWGYIDDSLLHGCFFLLVIRITMFYRIEIRYLNRPTAICRLLLVFMYKLLLWNTEQNYPPVFILTFQLAVHLCQPLLTLADSNDCFSHTPTWLYCLMKDEQTFLLKCTCYIYEIAIKEYVT